MDKTDQVQSAGFSKSEKIHLAWSVVFGLIAPLITFWFLGIFDADGPVFSLWVVLAGLLSVALATIIPVMGETVIEDIIKIFLFGVIWLVARKYGMLGQLVFGMLIGCTTGFFSNRLLDRR